MDNELENKVSQEESVLDTQPDLQPEGAGTPAELTEDSHGADAADQIGGRADKAQPGSQN